METIEDVPFWINKYYRYLPDNCISKMYRKLHNCKIAETTFLSMVWDDFNWKFYVNDSYTKKIKIDSRVCRLFADIYPEFCGYGVKFNTNILSLEDAEFCKDRINKIYFS